MPANKPRRSARAAASHTYVAIQEHGELAAAQPRMPGGRETSVLLRDPRMDAARKVGRQGMGGFGVGWEAPTLQAAVAAASHSFTRNFYPHPPYGTRARLGPRGGARAISCVRVHV
jgi:hypothetical protein